MNPSLLIVEAEAICRESLAKLLQSKGYRITAAGDGVGALRALQGSRPDLMLLSLKLPRLSGVDLLRVLRRAPAFRDLPVIVFAEQMLPDEVRLVASLGV